jgi:predicted RNase H-like HicB family nuclease
MKYPVATEKGNDKTAWCTVVPDLPGCFSASDGGMDDALKRTKEAIELWIETALKEGKVIPRPSSINIHQKNPEFKGWVWASVEITPTFLIDELETALINSKKDLENGNFVIESPEEHLNRLK